MQQYVVCVIGGVDCCGGCPSHSLTEKETVFYHLCVLSYILLFLLVALYAVERQISMSFTDNQDSVSVYKLIKLRQNIAAPMHLDAACEKGVNKLGKTEG